LLPPPPISAGYKAFTIARKPILLKIYVGVEQTSLPYR
jgi:hypothetical protein